MANPYHLDVIKTSMTRNIGAKFTEIYEEVVTAYKEGIPESTGVYRSVSRCINWDLIL